MSSTPLDAETTVVRKASAATASPAEAHAGRRAVALLAPGVLLFLAVVVWSILQTVWRSFYVWDGVTAATWAGVDNYRHLLSDPLVRAALIHSGVLILFTCVAPVAIGLLLAVLLSRARTRGLPFFRTLLFAPQVLSGIAIGIIWKWMYDPTDGPINQGLISIGLPHWAKPWLGDFSLALPAIGVIGTWATMGLCMVLMLAGIQKIPPSLYDAARVDGAGWFAELRAVTLPGLRNEMIVAITITLIIALRIFDIVFVTTKGGPGDETYVPSLLIYLQAFQYGFVGSAAALAVLLGAIIMVLSITIHRIGERSR
jgi:raffinose/stachyose/melibiose transport system permease protein